MPKMKSHKGLKKRVRITRKGKVVHKHPNAGHLMSGKSGNRCRALRQNGVMKPALARRIKALIGD